MLLLSCLYMMHFKILHRGGLPECVLCSFYFAHDGYCDQRVCLFVRSYVEKTRTNLTKFSLHVIRGRGLVLLGRQCNRLCTSVFVDDIMFSYNGGNRFHSVSQVVAPGAKSAMSDCILCRVEWCLKLNMFSDKFSVCFQFKDFSLTWWKDSGWLECLTAGWEVRSYSVAALW